MRFCKGHIPWNTGMRGLRLCPGKYLFQKGHLRGTAAREWRPVGTIIIKKKPNPQHKGKGARGFRLIRYIKIADERGVRDGSNWIAYARWVWEQKYGAIPKGQCVVHLDLDMLNDDIDNLFLMTRVQYLEYIKCRFPERHLLKRQRMSKARFGYRKIRKTEVTRTFFECSNCSAEYNEIPIRCTKCGSYSVKQTIVNAKSA